MTTQTPDAVREDIRAGLIEFADLIDKHGFVQALSGHAEILRQAAAALDSRAGDAGEGHAPCPYTCSGCLGRSKRRCETATPAPAVDAVAAGEVDWVAKAAERMASIAAIPDAMIDAALNARVPGGAPVLAWLPMEDGWTPSETARDIIRHALFAALSHGEGRK